MLAIEDKHSLSRVALESIKHGLKHRKPIPITLSDYSNTLRKTGCSFITLKKRGKLRGCIGSVEAKRPLVEDVAENAYAAAFRDPRFPLLELHELNYLTLNLSVLTKPEQLKVNSEQELLDTLRPGVDGLIITQGSRRATFLPAVWESLPEAKDLVCQLKQKAGLPPDYWSKDIRFERYHTETWSREETKNR